MPTSYEVVEHDDGQASLTVTVGDKTRTDTVMVGDADYYRMLADHIAAQLE